MRIGTHITTNPAPLIFSTSPGGNASGIERMRITGTGNVGIDTPDDPSEKLDIGIGNVRVRDIFASAGSVATDRVVVADVGGVLKTIAVTNLNNNIYLNNGTLSGPRVVNMNSNQLTFSTAANGSILFNTNNLGSASQSITGATNRGNLTLNGGNATVDLYVDNSAAAQLTIRGGATSLNVGTSTGQAKPLNLITNGLPRATVTPTGNLGIDNSSPTEKLDLNGIARFRGLPLNGATNAINTQSNGAASAAQDQTFTATRTVVADANGVLGYVPGVPTDAGIPKLLVSAGVPGVQSINGGALLVGRFSVENLDVYNAWDTSDPNNNFFTVPANMGGIFVLSMQTSHTHTVASETNNSWNTIASFQKSTNNGVTWQNLIQDTQSSKNSSEVANGNSLNWTGLLGAGDRIRVRFSCSAVASNIIELGSFSITRVNQ